MACEYNEILFPLLLLVMLQYLTEGDFFGVCDIVLNPLRPGINLAQRYKLMEGCFNTSHPTMVHYGQSYKDFRAAILMRESYD